MASSEAGPSKPELHHAFAVSEKIMVEMVSTVTEHTKNGPRGTFLTTKESVSPDTIFFADPAVKKTVIEMHQVFDECRQLSAVQPQLSLEESLAFSLRYRSVLQRAAVARGTAKGKADFIAWSLFEALFLGNSNNPVALDLAAWASTSFRHPTDILSSCIEEVEREMKPIEETADYWKSAVFLLTSFRFDMCAQLLSDHSVQDEATESFITALRRMDFEWLNERKEVDAYINWQSVIRELLEAGTFDSNMNIKFLAGIITGEMPNYQRMADVIVPEWWQLVPFYVMTFHPRVAIDQVEQVTERCHSMFPQKENEDIFRSLFKFDALSVLQEMCDPPYLAVHLCDLLHKDRSELVDSAMDLREWLLLDYGNMLMAKTDLWEIGADYLCEVGPTGRGAVEQHLFHMHIDGERTANKIWRIAKKEHLDEAGRMVVSTMTNRYVRNGSWAAALGWALRGDRKCRAVDTACNAILFKATCEQVTHLSILEQVGDLIMQSPGLVFLYNYYQFNKLLLSGQLAEAVRKLVVMVQSSSVPPRFHNKLFEHLLEILGTGDQLVLEKTVVYSLMSFLKQFSIDSERENRTENDLQILNLKQLLAKAYARSVVNFK